MLRTTIAFTLGSVLGLGLACTATNTNHCNYRGGDEFCAQTHGERRFCSICEAESQGCTQTPPDASCLPEGSSSASADTTESSASIAGTDSDDASASSTSSNASMTGSGDGTNSGPTSTTAATTTASATTSSTTTTSMSTSTATSTETDDGPVCGDNMAEDPEHCDGTDLDGKGCSSFPPWSGGTLACAENCGSFDLSGCCLGAGSMCNVLDSKCCDGYSCNLGTCE